MFNHLVTLYTKHKEIILYLIMGFATTFVNWIVYAGAVSAVSVFAANIIAWIVAVIFAYITNKIFVFASHDWHIKFIIREFGLFVSARLITGVLEIVGVPFLIQIGINQRILGIEGMASKILVSVVVTILNYVFSKLIIFKKKKNAY